MLKAATVLIILTTAVALTEAASLAAPPRKAIRSAEPSYLPDAAASRIVTVTETGAVGAAIIVLTEAVAIKETGPPATVARFGEVYAFSPAFVAVHRDEPTEIGFWNLQPDDEHDVMLVAPDSQVLMHVVLPPLRRRPTSSPSTRRVSSRSTARCTNRR